MSSRPAPKKGASGSSSVSSGPRRSFAPSAAKKPAGSVPYASRKFVSSAPVPSSIRSAPPPVNRSVSTWAPAVSLAPRKKEGKKKKSKTHKAISFLKGAAKVAAQVAPAVLPLLLAGHAPTNLAAKAAGVSGVPDMSSAGMVGVSSAVSVAKYATGTYVPTFRQSAGRVVGVSWPGCEELATVGNPPTGTSWKAGDVMLKISLNPLDPDWAGTQLTVQARLWQNYRLKRLSVMFQPSAATTTAGQMIGFCISDPDEDWQLSGDAAVKAALAHQFSDIFNVWSVGCWGMAIDKDQPSKYTQGDLSDPRLTSPGYLYLLCSADIDMTSIDTLGTIVVAYEYDFDVKADDDPSYYPGAGVAQEWNTATNIAAQGANSYVPMGLTLIQPSSVTGGLAPAVTVSAVTSNGGNLGYGFNLPSGMYSVNIVWKCTGTGTCSGLTTGIYTNWLADTTNGSGVYADIGKRVIVSPTGSNVITSGAYTGSFSSSNGSAVPFFQNGTTTVAYQFIVNSDIPTSFYLYAAIGTQTGTWVEQYSTVNIFSLKANLFIPPSVSPLQALQKTIAAQRQETEEIEKKLDALSSLMCSLVNPVAGPSPPHSNANPSDLWSRLLSSYGAMSPADRADAVASLSTASQYTYTAGQ